MSDERAPSPSNPASRAAGPARLLLLIGVLLAGLPLLTRPGDPRVVRPRLGIAAVVEPAGELELTLEPAPLMGGGPRRVELVRPDGSARLDLGELAPERGLGPRRVRLAVPADAGPGAWDLHVSGSPEEQVLPRAVHVRADWPERLRVVFLADLPTFWADGSGELAMARLVDEANLLDPDLVLIGGDIVYGGSEPRYQALLRQVTRFEAPVVHCIGNHEYEDLRGYREHLASFQHVVDVGPLRLVCTNSAHGRDAFTVRQLDWLAEALDTNPGLTPLVLVHHPLFGPRRLGVGVDRVVELCEAHAVPLVLSGHRHADLVYDGSRAERPSGDAFDGTLYVVTTSGGADLHPEHGTGESYHGLRLLELEREPGSGRYRPTRISYDADGDGRPEPSASWPTGLLRWTFEADGSLVVHNGWSERAVGLRVPRSLLAGESVVPGPEPVPVRRDLPATWSTTTFDLDPGESRRFEREDA